MKVSIIGEGAWGTAVSTVLAENGHDVLIWCYHENIVSEINIQHHNRRFMPGAKLSKNIKATSSLKEVIEYSDYIFEAIPVKYLRSVLEKSRPFAKEGQYWISLSKGIESDALLLPTQMFDDAFGNKTRNCAISGPSFAKELVQKDLTAVACASENEEVAIKIAELVNNDYFRACITTDLIGIQAAGALKNVITLGVGFLQGYEQFSKESNDKIVRNPGDNAIAMAITIGMSEISQLVKKMGGTVDTVYGLAGLGDLVLTTTGKYSRNLEVGRKIGSGQTLQRIIEETGYTPEGINTVKSVFKLSKKYDVSLPFCSGIFNVINGSRTVQDLIPNLFNCLV